MPSELDGKLLPARLIMADTCQCVYRSSECGYTGSAMFTAKDVPTHEARFDNCSHRLSGCTIRKNQRNFGAFIAVNKL